MSSTTTSLALVSSNALRVRDAELTRLQRAVVQQHELILHETSTTALRALFIGVALHRIKGSLPHGAFGPWLAENFKGVGRRMINYYMIAALVFIGELAVTQKELCIAPDGKFELSLESRSVDVKRFVAKARKFIGDLSFSELLAKHGIKERGKLGGARARGPAGGGKIDPEELAALKRDEFSDWHARGRQLCVEENIFQHLKTNEIRAAVEALEALTTDVRAAVKPLLRRIPA